MKTVLVTGGSGKVGVNVVSHLIDLDYNVLFTARTRGSVNSVEDRFAVDNGRIHGFVVDFTSERSVSEFLDQLLRHGLKVNGLVNNARCTDFLALSKNGACNRKNFLGEYLIDVVVPYELSIALSSLNNGLSSVVNVGSQYGLVSPNPYLYGDGEVRSPIQYGSAKAALEQLTRELAVRLGKAAIRVNCVAFGGVRNGQDSAFMERYSKLNPMGRMIETHDIGGPVEFLLSDASSGITGQTIRVDNGWTIW